MEIAYYLVDVFTSQKYGGNQLAVFVDYENRVSDTEMLQIAKELNFPEITFIKKNRDNKVFDIRIFTPEYEVPFAGHPSLGTAFVIAKYLVPTVGSRMTLHVKHGEIPIELTSTDNTITNSLFVMQQAAPEFINTFTHEEVAEGLGIPIDYFDMQQPVEEITTGLPYIVIPIVNLEKMNALQLNAQKVIAFLKQHKKYKINSSTGLTTSLFFATDQTFEQGTSYNTRMFCVENEVLVEDAATGSANGCFLAYLLKYEALQISAVVEQGFQLNRKSHIYLEGTRTEDEYEIKIGGKVVEVSSGHWKL